EFIEVCLRNLLNPDVNVALSFTRLRKCKADGTLVDPDYSDRVHCLSKSMLRRSFQYLYFGGGNQYFYGLYRKRDINPWFFATRFGSDQLAVLTLLRQGCIHIDKRVLF